MTRTLSWISYRGFGFTRDDAGNFFLLISDGEGIIGPFESEAAIMAKVDEVIRKTEEQSTNG